jgi:hypothetical protein
MNIKYPNIQVQLTGTAGNVFSVLGKVIKALKVNGVPQSEVDAFWEEASSGDCDNALRVCLQWVDVA